MGGVGVARNTVCPPASRRHRFAPPIRRLMITLPHHGATHTMSPTTTESAFWTAHRVPTTARARAARGGTANLRLRARPRVPMRALRCAVCACAACTPGRCGGFVPRDARRRATVETRRGRRSRSRRGAVPGSVGRQPGREIINAQGRVKNASLLPCDIQSVSGDGL